MNLQTPILITGASGFVGANLLRRLIKEVPSEKVHIILRKNSDTWRINDLLKKVSVHVIDLRNQSDTLQLIQKVKPKIIFHLAAYGAYPYQVDEKEMVETNIICTFNLMETCMKVEFESFINTGSSSEYGINQNPMSESDICSPVTSYGVSKVWASLYSKYLSMTKEKNITTLRPFGVYGFYEQKGRLIANIILALLKKEQPTLATYYFARDFVFVDDVVEAYLLAIKNNSAGMIFNIGSGKQTTLGEVFQTIKTIMGKDIEPLLGTSDTGLFDTNRRIADNKLAKKYLGWEPRTNLYNGLEQTIKWFKENVSLYL